MASSLKENYNSEYVRQSNRLTGRSRIVEVWVEDEYDVPFWNDLLAQFSDLDFHLTPYRRNKLNKGKGDILKYAHLLGPNLIACVDSDYDYLLPGCSEASEELKSNPYVLHTITYAIENWNCHPATLEKICINATLGNPEFDFIAFFTEYSHAIYPLLLWSLMFRKEKMHTAITFNDFKEIIDIPFNISSRNSNQAIQTVAAKVKDRTASFAHDYPRLHDRMPSLEKEIAEKGVTQDNCYLFINGHVLEEITTQRILAPICKKTVRKHIEMIFQSKGSIDEKERKKAHYDNITRRSLSVLLASNFEYKQHSKLYESILQPKVQRLVQQLKHDIQAANSHTGTRTNTTTTINNHKYGNNQKRFSQDWH